VYEGVTRLGGQEHFYLETNAALSIPSGEDGAMEVWSSTQNTMETQEFVSSVLGVPSNRINARVKRMGGGFGGKESRSVPFAVYTAIAARKEKRPVRLMLNRDEDMLLSGQRHPFQVRWKVGVTNEGKLLALEADVYNNAGFSQDMSGAVMDRCMTHLDNSYECPNVFLRGHVCRTNIHSNTAFRGFGAPQGMYFSETIMYNIAEGLGLDIDDLRQKNLYKIGEHTPFFQKIDEDWHVPMLLHQLAKSSGYEKRKTAIANFNSKNRWKKRGICLIPCKFGLSFATALHLNQGAAYIKIYHDGSVLLHHAGTEMGQGLHTKMCQIAAQELGTPLDAIYTQDSQTYQIANASPTAASAGSDLNGMAVKHACDQINERLQPLREKLGKDATLKDLAHAAYIERINLAANGFWKMPRVGYKWGDTNWETVKPMYYYWTQGAATSEVEVDLLTGDHTVLRSDIMMVSHLHLDLRTISSHSIGCRQLHQPRN
jgi:xanthine dehydrogenase/oxidase